MKTSMIPSRKQFSTVFSRNGRKLWSRGYFCATVGAVTEDTIKQYIENQEDTPKDFQVWDEAPLGDDNAL